MLRALKNYRLHKLLAIVAVKPKRNSNRYAVVNIMEIMCNITILNVGL